MASNQVHYSASYLICITSKGLCQVQNWGPLVGPILHLEVYQIRKSVSVTQEFFLTYFTYEFFHRHSLKSCGLHILQEAFAKYFGNEALHDILLLAILLHATGCVRPDMKLQCLTCTRAHMHMHTCMCIHSCTYSLSSTTTTNGNILINNDLIYILKALK